MSFYFPSPNECGHHTVFGSTQLRTAAGDHLQLSLVNIPADGKVDWHNHTNEQMGLVISGRAVFCIGDEEKTLGPGDFFRIPGGVSHRVIPVDGPVQAIDAFYPIRDEYR